MNNIKEFQNDKPVSAKPIFKAENGRIMAIRIMKNHQLKEHTTKIPALLICVDGKVIFENEKGLKATLNPGDYLNIEAMVKHWVEGLADSHLLLIR